MRVQGNRQGSETQNPEVSGAPGDFIIGEDRAGVACLNMARSEKYSSGLGPVSQLRIGDFLERIMALEFYGDMIAEAIGRGRESIVEIVPELRHA
jgi:hypothetical protein